MGIEVRQLLVKTNVLDDTDDGRESQSPESQIALKRAVLEECRQMIEEALNEIKER